MMNPLIQLKRSTPAFLIGFLFVCLGLSPKAQAISPPPDGGYPGSNTAEGDNALLNLTSGTNNTAIGFEALLNNTTGFQNTATGFGALERNTTGSDNTANGLLALALNTTGGTNTAIGGFALGDNTTGGGNTAIGFEALESNRAGDFNTASGFEALLDNRTGRNNTAAGFEALGSNATGNDNTAYGSRALVNLAAGSSNIAIGSNAGRALPSGDNNIDMGNAGVAGDAGTIRIGTQGTQTKTFIAGISGAAIGGTEVRVNQNGRLGTEPSSKRFKQVINPMDKASEVLLALRPVTFRYKAEIDPEGTPQFGLVAEDVEKEEPDLVVRDKEGKPYSVRYDAVNAMLLNEFLKEHRKVEQLTKAFESKFAEQQKQIERLTAGLQKVSEQLEISRPAPQTVNNP